MRFSIERPIRSKRPRPITGKRRLALLRRVAPDADKAELYAKAAGEFKRAADTAKALHAAAWRETDLLQWAVAAYEEADRLALGRNQPARDALTEALTRAEELKEFSLPWATLLTMKLWTEVQRKLEPTKDRIPDAVRISPAGLGPCREQDRPIQFMIRMLLVDYRTSFLRDYAGHKDGAKALANAQARDEARRGCEVIDLRPGSGPRCPGDRLLRCFRKVDQAGRPATVQGRVSGGRPPRRGSPVVMEMESIFGCVPGPGASGAATGRGSPPGGRSNPVGRGLPPVS